MKKYVFGIKIYLDTVETQDTSIGLYTSGGISWFRWIGNSITTTLTYKYGLIKTFDKISNSSDFTDGGNIAEIGETSVSIAAIATDGTQIWKKLSDAAITFNGLYCEIIEFDASTSPATETIIYRGICKSSEQGEEEFIIPIENADNKCDANSGTLIDNDSENGNFKDATEETAGDMIPITLGKIDKTKAIRVSKKQTVKTNNDFGAVITPLGYAFPVISDQSNPTQDYTIQLGESYSGSFNDSLFVGKFLHVIEGAGNSEFRKITLASHHASPNTTIDITIENYFTETLQGNSTATKTNQTWIEIVDINFSYNTDIWKGKGFLDEDETYTNDRMQSFTYTDEKTVTVETVGTKTPINIESFKFKKLPAFALIDNVGDANAVVLSTKILDSDKIDSISNYLILPVGIPSKISSNDLSNWRKDGSDDLNTYVRVTSGVFRNQAYPHNFLITITDFPTKMIDKDYASYTRFSIDGLYGGGVSNLMLMAVALSFKLPSIPDNFEFDQVFIGIRLNKDYTTAAAGIEQHILLRYRRFMGFAKEINDYSHLSTNNNVIYDDLADFYYRYNIPTTGNKNFLVTVNNDNNYTGVNQFELSDIDTVEKYNSIKEIGLIIKNYNVVPVPPNYLNLLVDIFEIAVIFKKSFSVDEKVFIKTHGRIFNDTWGGRKTAINLMENPIDQMEHFLRLANWSEVGSIVNFGKEYSNGALINVTNAEGGFDWIGLDAIRNYKSSRQIFDIQEAKVSSIIQSLCKQFFLCNYKDRNGNECVNMIKKLDTTPSVSIDFDDIIGDMTIEEIPYENIYCEPVVNYNENYGNDKFDNIIKITNANAGSFSSSYVTGYKGESAELLWNMAHALWLKYRIINVPPSDLTDCEWIRTEEDAERYLLQWFEHQGVYLSTAGEIKTYTPKRCTFTVPYELATTIGASHLPWFVSMHLLITHPFHTDNSAIQSIIESVDFDIDSLEPVAEITALMLNPELSLNLYIKNSFNSYSSIGHNDWKNTLLTKAENPSNENDIKGII